MAVKIRLKRMGMKKKPFYRVVVADIRSPRDGRFIDEIGYYNPLTNPAEISIDAEKAKKWLGNGAQPTDTVRILLKKTGVLEDKEGYYTGKAAPAKAAAVAPEAPVAAPEEAPAAEATEASEA